MDNPHFSWSIPSKLGTCVSLREGCKFLWLAQEVTIRFVLLIFFLHQAMIFNIPAVCKFVFGSKKRYQVQWSSLVIGTIHIRTFFCFDLK